MPHANDLHDPANVPNAQKTNTSACGEGCKYLIIGGVALLIVGTIMGGLVMMVNPDYYSSHTTGNSLTQAPTSQYQYTTKVTTVISTQLSMSSGEADAKYVTYVPATLDPIVQLAYIMAGKAAANDIIGLGVDGDSLESQANAAIKLVEPLPVSSTFKESKDNYVLALQYYSSAGKHLSLAADAYKSNKISDATSLINVAQDEISQATTHINIAKYSLQIR